MYVFIFCINSQNVSKKMFIDVVFIDSVLQSSEDIYRECLSGLYMENVFVFMDSAFLVCIWAWTVSFWCVYGHEQCLSGMFMDSVFLLCWWQLFFSGAFIELFLNMVRLLNYFSICCVHWTISQYGAFIELFLNMVRLLDYVSIFCNFLRYLLYKCKCTYPGLMI